MKRTNRIWHFILTLVLCVSMLPVGVSAAGEKTYLVLGDSISTGYGLDGYEQGSGVLPEEAFAALLAAELGETYTTVNKAEDGETAASLLTKLTTDEYITAVTNADFITLTLGGNDLMGLMYEYLATALSSSSTTYTPEEVKEMLTGSSGSMSLSLISKIASAVNSSAFDTYFADTSKITAIASDFASVISAVRALNADAVFIVETQYNPYEYLAEQASGYTSNFLFGNAAKAIVKLSATIHTVLGELNGQIKTTAGGNYRVADVYTAFHAEFTENGTQLCNAYLNMSSLSINMDFHPNAVGHALIARVFMKHSHCICGTGTNDAHASHIAEEFIPWEDSTALPTDAGNYYLKADVTFDNASEGWQPADGTVLCLNGHSITNTGGKRAIRITNGTFTLCDCAETPGVISGDNSGSAVEIDSGCTFNMYGGTIIGNTAELGGGSFNLYGGSIRGNTHVSVTSAADGRCSVTVTGIEDSSCILIAARYDDDGKLTDLSLQSITPTDGVLTVEAALSGTGTVYKAFLLDALTYIPICAASEFTG